VTYRRIGTNLELPTASRETDRQYGPTPSAQQVTQAVVAPPTTLRVADTEKDAVRRSVVGLAVIVAITAAGRVL